MSKFNWLDEFKIGNDIVDKQHHYLFELANQVYEAEDMPAIIKCGEELFRYIREHFRDEERLMKRSGYPGYQAHVAMHDDLLLRLEGIAAHLTKDDFKNDSLNQLMVDWLLSHILKEDMLIGEYLRHSNSEAKAEAD